MQLQLCYIQVSTFDNVHTMVQKIPQPIYYHYLVLNYQNCLVLDLRHPNWSTNNELQKLIAKYLNKNKYSNIKLFSSNIKSNIKNQIKIKININ